MNTNTEIAILLVVCSIMLLFEHKNIARCLVSFWQTGTIQKVAYFSWVVILAVIVCLVCFIHGFIKYFMDESTRMQSDTELEILVDRMTPKKSVKVVKQTPLNHARIVAHVKPVKKAKNYRGYYRAFTMGLRLMRFF